MKELAGRVAVVTGGGSGIGRGMAIAFAEAGMRVALADVETSAAVRVRDELIANGAEAAAFPVDVSELDSLTSLADAVYETFGGTHLLCNNAGVSVFSPLHATRDADWRWVLGVNLMGVVHGIQAFLPRMKAQAGEKHVVNTASIAGLVPFPALGPYVASKYAVVGLSETLRLEGASYGLSCSVLCPGNVRTQIIGSARNRPAQLGGPDTHVDPRFDDVIQGGLDPLAVGRRVRAGVEADELFILTHPELRERVAERNVALLTAFDDAGA